ncbi:MAG: hypothetical protein H7Y15_02810 [Pseudonocardia sp.]|nr:hypothetical protein [Pseudonocardia sp.]
MNERATRRIGSRLRRRLTIAVLAGPLIGLAIGAVVATVVFDAWGRGATMVVLGAVVASTLLALLWAGYSSLESPDPGHEPSDTERPIADRPELTREEKTDPVEARPSDGLHAGGTGNNAPNGA